MTFRRLYLKLAETNQIAYADTRPSAELTEPSERKRLSRPRRLSRRRALSAILVFTLIPTSISVGGFPELIERSGRYIGRGYGDGYHACHSSGLRPLANLPPRTYAARVGTVDERIHGCATCRPRPLPGVDPIRYQNPETFYHRFDRYAQAVSHQEALQGRRPQSPLVDPEADLARGYSLLDPDGNRHEESDYGHRFLSPQNNMVDGMGQDSSMEPQISEEEMAEFREFQETKRLRNKFDKYLIDPKKTEPRQIIGGPPVGTEQRRRSDEAKVRKLQEKLRRELADEAAAKKAAQEDFKRFTEDSLTSPSDIEPGDDERSSSLLDLEEDSPLPMDELLPPFPDKVMTVPDARQLPVPQSAFPDPDRRRPGFERIPTPKPTSPGMRERLDEFDSAKPERLQQTQLEFNAPMQTQVDSEPAARVATIPENWRFVKQPQ